MTTYAKPRKLPIKNIDPAVFYKELADASYALGQLQIAHGKISNSEHLIKPLITREAAVSSKIEGTITDSKDVFILDATGKAPKQDTIVVANYREAMRLAISLKEQKNISNHKIRQLHAVLLRNTPHRGSLGRYREIDAWIGKSENTPIEEALYVAVHPTLVQSYMDNLIEYFNSSDETPLVKVAIFHYQLEAIHPFEDGNGRIGRMLLPALLHYLDSLTAPVIYTSEFFEKESLEYRRQLHQVDETGDMTPWIVFFLGAIKAQCEISINLVENIINLNQNRQEEYRTSQSPNLSRLIDYIFEKPVFTITEVTNSLGITRLTSKSLLNILERDQLIEELPGIKGNHGATIYFYPELLRLINI